MPIPFVCPYCGARSDVDDHLAGQTGACSTCNQTVTIPLDGASAVPKQGPAGNRFGWLAAMIMVVGVLAIGALVAIGWLLMPTLKQYQTANHRTSCGNNLKQIALALHSYHDAHGSFPPAYLADAKGKPMHSWRVLILPYMNAQHLYDRYNFNEPWDGPTNSMLTKSMPAAYICPHNPDPAARRAGETNYMVVIGQDTMFPGAQAVSIPEVTDGLLDTIMLVEATAKGVNWLSPVDLEMDSMAGQINASTKEVSSFHPEGGANVAMGDGSVQFIPQRTRSRALYNSLTKSGGEQAHLRAVPK